MVSFSFTVENQTEEDYTLNLTDITPPATQYNPPPAQVIDDGDDDDFALDDAGDELVSIFTYRLDDEDGDQVGTYRFIFRFDGQQIVYQEAHSDGLDVFLDVQDNGANGFTINITCQLEPEESA